MILILYFIIGLLFYKLIPYFYKHIHSDVSLLISTPPKYMKATILSIIFSLFWPVTLCYMIYFYICKYKPQLNENKRYLEKLNKNIEFWHISNYKGLYNTYVSKYVLDYAIAILQKLYYMPHICYPTYRGTLKCEDVTKNGSYISMEFFPSCIDILIIPYEMTIFHQNKYDILNTKLMREYCVSKTISTHDHQTLDLVYKAFKSEYYDDSQILEFIKNYSKEEV